MASINTKATVAKEDVRLAGGFGALAAKQSSEALLRRSVLACLLWEDLAYADGTTAVSTIQSLVSQVDPEVVAKIAVEARFEQKLRHVPLLICREMAKLPTHKSLVAETLATVIHRPDELKEFLAMYWKDNSKKKTLSYQVKRGLAKAFGKFNEYQLAKYNQKDTVSLRDVLFLCHAKAKDPEQDALWKKLIDRTLETPDTWEVNLSKATSVQEKMAVWVRLIEEKKLGAFAFLKNLRNMQEANVPDETIRTGLSNLKTDMLLPIDFLKAQKYAPKFTKELENAMFACTAQWPKLPGKTVFVVDVSGSMGMPLSGRSEFSRMDAAAAMAVLAAEMCEEVVIYATAGSDGARTHKTAKVGNFRGFNLSEEILKMARSLGGGGIFTRQCLEYIKSQGETADRVIVFSDSQDCDIKNKIPNPFGKHNYIVDVSAHKHGINYNGVWTAEISGWSEGFLKYIANLERE